MAGYWDLVQQMPRLDQIVGQSINAYQQARANKMRESQLEMQQKAFDEKAKMMKQQAQGKQGQGLAEFGFNALEHNPVAAPKIAQLLRARGIEIPQGIEQDPIAMKHHLGAIASSSGKAVDFASPATEKDPFTLRAALSDPVGKRVISQYGFEPGSKEYREAYSGIQAQEDLKKTEELASKVGERGLKNASALRKEFLNLPTVRDALDVNVAYRKIANSSDNAAGHMALIFNYMKMLDPGSTVREGEYATAKNAGGVDERVRATWNSLVDGRTLGPGQFGMFKNEARKVLGSQMSMYRPIAENYARVAEKAGVDPADVVFDLGFGGSGDSKRRAARSKQSRMDALPPPVRARVESGELTLDRAESALEKMRGGQ